MALGMPIGRENWGRRSDHGPAPEPEEPPRYPRARCATCGRYCPGRERYGQPASCSRCAVAWLKRHFAVKVQ